VGVWYPTEATPHDQRLAEFTQSVAAGPDAPVAGSRHALVVISHGSGGWYGGHYDLALKLAHAGFIVAGVTHWGDSYENHTLTAAIQRRPRQLKALVDYMLAAWPQHAAIDAGRIGVYGFSAGGFTALVAAGGAPDLRTVGPHCQAHPDVFDCSVLKESHIDPATMRIPPGDEWVHDPRIKAAAVAAPALGFAFGREGLKDIHVPVQLWRAEFDHILPNPDYAEAVRVALPRPPEFHMVAGADHYDFLAVCPHALAEHVSEICVSRPGFDRAAFHQDLDTQVTAFFLRTLR
jgi:predicted dienelactone hydrolase